MDGWIKSHRKVMNSLLWQASPETFKLAYTCLHLANSSPAKVLLKSGEVVDLTPGQFITTSRNLAQKAVLTHQITRTALSRLESQALDFLTRDVTHGVTLITIKNWGVYQSNEEDENTMSNTELTQQQHNTNTELTQNKNKIREDLEYSSLKKDSHTLDEIQNLDPASGAASAEAKDSFSNGSNPPTAEPEEPKSEPPEVPPKKERKKPTGPHADCIDYFVTAFAEKLGVKYLFNDAKDGAAMAAMVKTYPTEKIMDMIDLFLDETDAFKLKFPRTIAVLRSQAVDYSTREIAGNVSGPMTQEEIDEIVAFQDSPEVTAYRESIRLRNEAEAARKSAKEIKA